VKPSLSAVIWKIPLSRGLAKRNWPSLLLLVARIVWPFFKISTMADSSILPCGERVMPTMVLGV